VKAVTQAVPPVAHTRPAAACVCACRRLCV